MKNLLSFLVKPFVQSGVSKPVANPEEGLRWYFNRNRNSSLNHSICLAPSVNMVFSQDGGIKACCHNSENLLGRYPEQSISEIWNSNEAKAFRQKMSEYKLLSGCSVCANDYQSKSFDEMPAKHFDTIQQHPAYPTMMEFLLSNTCNLECVMCNGDLSSSIRKNRDKLPAIKSPYDKSFVAQLKEFIPYLKETRFSGAGEAFLIDTNFEIWEMLIAENPECLITVQTNGTVMNARVKDLLQRGNFKIGVSLDSLKQKKYESIRLNASYDRVMENIQYLSDYSNQNNRPFTISTCVMRDNWQELPEFIRFCNRINAHATFHKVWSPAQHALYNLPENELRTIYNQLSHIQFSANNNIEKKNKNHYEYFISVIGGWLKDATNRKETFISLRELPTPELLQKANGKLKNHIHSQQMLEGDKQQLVSDCEKKVADIMQLCKTETERRNILISMCETRTSSIIAAIKGHSSEKLYEMSLGYSKTQ